MSWFGSLWLSEEIARLEGLKQILRKPDEIAAIDMVIAGLRAQEKDVTNN